MGCCQIEQDELAVNVSPAEPRIDPSAVEDALGEIRGMADQFDRFFADVFDELQSAAVEVVAQHNDQAASRLPEEAIGPSALGQQICESLDDLRTAQNQTLQIQEQTRRLLDEVLTVHQQLLEQRNMGIAKT
jgi:hypothetical protein